METQTINISEINIGEIAPKPTIPMDAQWDREVMITLQKKKNLQIGTRVIIAHNLEGNMDEPFIGLQGIIIRFKKGDWYQVVLESQTIYGNKFNFHIDEIEII